MPCSACDGPAGQIERWGSGVACNRIFESRPAVAEDGFVLANPTWLLLMFRIALLACGPMLLVLTLLSRSPLPVPALLLAAVVGVGTFGGAAWARPWTRPEFFVADAEGISFPANDLLVVRLGGAGDTRWLRVPWSNIGNVRITRVRGEGTPCVAFDVTATADESEAFFGRVDRPEDRPADSAGIVFAAYDIRPPSPARTVAALRSLSARRGTDTVAHRPSHG